MSRALAWITACVIAVFGFLPIVNWLPGGRAAPWYSAVAGGWLSGTAIVVGGGLVLGILSRRLTFLWRTAPFESFTTRFRVAPVRAALLVATAALAVYAGVAVTVFDARPLLIDELVQVLQARMFAAGELSRTAAPHPEFFSSLHLVDTQGRVYSQFPAGGPAMLALGVLLGAPWLVGPLCGAVSVAAYVAFLRAAESRTGVVAGAALLFALAPLTVFMSGSHMNHVPTLMWLLIALAFMARVMRAQASRPLLAFLSGLGFGCAATIRPIDALAFALPAGIWYLARILRDRSRCWDTLAAGLGVAIPVLVLMWVNVRTTGAPLLFGYEVLWGKEHALGFHRAPWGMDHTPARGLELVNLYFLRLQTYLFETPVPSLLPAVAALALTRRLNALDRYLLSSAGLLVGLYFAYWHDGFYLGPRFLFPLIPVLSLWTVRLLPMLRERVGAGLAYRTAVYSCALAPLIAITALIPLRARQYTNGFLTMRWEVDSAAESADVRNALVFVRESWGAQLMARMWALGIRRSDAELLYRHVDSCLLDQQLLSLEQESRRGTAAFDVVRQLLRDSSRVVASPFSPDTTERYLPGTRYSTRCANRVNEDRGGFTLLPPLLLAQFGNNVFARDLHERNVLLLDQYPNRPLYLLRPPSAGVGAWPQFYALSRDSLMQAWRRPAPGVAALTAQRGATPEMGAWSTPK